MQHNDGLVLTVRFSLRPSRSKEEILEDLRERFQPEEDLISHLHKELPERIIRTWNTRENYYFFREDRRPMVKGKVKCWVTGLDSSFAQFPNPTSITIHES